MRYNITIEDEAVESLFREILVQDYRSLMTDVRVLKKKRKMSGLEFYEQQDLDNNLHYKNAIEVMLTYYLPHDKAQNIIKELNNE